MKLPQSKLSQLYLDEIKGIEEELKEATDDGYSSVRLTHIQEELDMVAERYQDDKGIGAARYKLYELQALVHYFQGNDEEAWDFINYAIETRGSVYPRAQKLKSQLNHKAATTQNKESISSKNKKLVGLDGWLALFIVGLGLGIVLNIFALYSYPSAFSDIASAQSQSPDLVSAMTPILWFEVFQYILLVGMAIYLIVLLAKRKSLARNIAIIFMITSVVLGIIDYAWAGSVFATFNLDMDGEMSKAAGDVGRSIIAGLVWVPYFVVSKRVKTTLIR